MGRATIKDVALKAGVSIATVSRYINNNGNVSKKISEKINKAIKELDYIPNSVAISLKKAITKTIGIVVPDLLNVSFMDTVKGISDKVLENGYEPLILCSDENSDKENNILDVLVSKRVDGIVIASVGKNEEKILKINNKNIPIVLVDRDVCNKSQHTVIDAVVNDNLNGSFKIINYLISLGHKRIAIISNKNSIIGMERFRGYIKALKQNNIPINPNYIMYGDFSFKSGYDLIKEMMLQPLKPTAIFFINNLMALGAVAALNEMNISIPFHISICAFGDFKYYNILNPTMTVVNQMAYDVGKKAAELLIEKIKNYNHWVPKKIIIPADIIIRNSCSKPFE
ncbi:MAG TPA: LacI family transcriptional regulator [Thermoanaerobacterales bacterium]|nr:LacI family transcriptional regulator [Thermoanaerobacterales bacterium]